MRLAKYLAHAGVASRRAAEGIVAQGRVTVGGEVVFDPARDVHKGSGVAVDGRPVQGAEERVAYALNKPLGVLSTAHDPYGRPTVVELLAGADSRRLYPVGRLDADSGGLMLLTNDGQLAHRLTHPSFEVPRTYLARVSGGRVGEAALRRLREGVRLEDGITAPARVRRVPATQRSEPRATRRGGAPRGDGPPRRSGAPGGGRPSAARGEAGETLEIVIHEGRNRQVRRMCEAVGHPVTARQRVAFGPLELGSMPAGAYRRLSQKELAGLRALANTAHPARAERRRARKEDRGARSARSKQGL